MRIRRERSAQSAIRNPQLRSGGFNLVEALVATMILSGAVLTLGAIGTNALSGTRLHRHYEMAAALVDKQLSLIDYMGIDAFIEAGQTEGIVEELEPAYHWSVTTEYQGVDSLYLVTIVVSWLEGVRPYSVTAQTMLDGTGAVTGTGTVRAPARKPGGSRRNEESERIHCGFRIADCGFGASVLLNPQSAIRNPQCVVSPWPRSWWPRPSAGSSR